MSAATREATAVRDRPVRRPTSPRVVAIPSRISVKTRPTVAGFVILVERTVETPRDPVVMFDIISGLISRVQILNYCCFEVKLVIVLHTDTLHRSLEILMPVTVRVPMCDFVILGVTGDLAVRKLLSALYRCDRDS